jgi:hypothetical protein
MNSWAKHSANPQNRKRLFECGKDFPKLVSPKCRRAITPGTNDMIVIREPSDRLRKILAAEVTWKRETLCVNKSYEIFVQRCDPLPSTMVLLAPLQPTKFRDSTVAAL